MINFNKKILIASIGLITLENLNIIFNKDPNPQRFLSFSLSLILVNILFFLKETKYFIPLQYLVYLCLLLWYWPFNTIINDPGGTTVLVVISFVVVLLGFLVERNNNFVSSLIILIIFAMGFYFSNRTLNLSIGFFIFFKLIDKITSLNFLSKSSFHSFVYPASIILIIIYFGIKFKTHLYWVLEIIFGQKLYLNKYNKSVHFAS